MLDMGAQSSGELCGVNGGAAIPGRGAGVGPGKQKTAPVETGAVVMAEANGLVAVVAFLAVFGEVEADRFHFLARAEADNRFHDIGDDHRADDGEHEGQADGFHLFDP